MHDEILRIAGEALRNAFRQAHPQQIWVQIRYGAQQMQVRVPDNGRGIAANVLSAGSKQGHFGLAGMSERAELIGASRTASSAVQAALGQAPSSATRFCSSLTGEARRRCNSYFNRISDSKYVIPLDCDGVLSFR